MWLIYRLRASLARFSLARVSLTRASLAHCILARFSLARCQFHFGAFPNFVSMLIQYSRQFSFFSAKDSLARVAYLFVRQFAAEPLY